MAERPGRRRRVRPDPGRRRRGFVVVAILCFVVAAGALVVARATHRLPGQTSSGSVTLTDDQRLAQQLTQACVLAGQGRDLDAIKPHEALVDDTAPVAAAIESLAATVVPESAIVPEAVSE